MANSTDMQSLREEYSSRELHEKNTADEPITQFKQWFDEALEANVPEPNAMTLSTVSAQGRPSARIVLLKGVEDKAFRFYTNYESQKGQELQQTKRAALCFFWAELERQVRVEGAVEKLSVEDSKAYFSQRPRKSQLGAWASLQSRSVVSRQALQQQMAEAQQRFENEDVPMPPYWGGFTLKPIKVEFWQGRPGRLHDRIAYLRADEGPWHKRRLQP